MYEGKSELSGYTLDQLMSSNNSYQLFSTKKQDNKTTFLKVFKTNLHQDHPSRLIDTIQGNLRLYHPNIVHYNKITPYYQPPPIILELEDNQHLGQTLKQIINSREGKKFSSSEIVYYVVLIFIGVNYLERWYDDYITYDIDNIVVNDRTVMVDYQSTLIGIFQNGKKSQKTTHGSFLQSLARILYELVYQKPLEINLLDQEEVFLVEEKIIEQIELSDEYNEFNINQCIKELLIDSYRSRYKIDPLLKAKRKHTDKYIDLLLEEKISEISVENITPSQWLYFGCQTGNLQIVENAVNTDLSILKMEDDWWTPLICCCMNGTLEIAKFLVEQGLVDPNETTKYKWSPIVQASTSCKASIVKYLIEKGNVDPNYRTKAGMTPILFAALNNSLEIVQYLIEVQQVDPCERSGSNWCPLREAISRQHMMVIRYLVEVQDVQREHKGNLGYGKNKFKVRDYFDSIQ